MSKPEQNPDPASKPRVQRLPPSGVEGWYPDPHNPLYNRFWDGQQFTSHRIWNGELASMGPTPFRSNSAPGSIPLPRKPQKIYMGSIAAPGEPPVNLQGPNPFLALLRKLFGDFRDPRQR